MTKPAGRLFAACLLSFTGPVQQVSGTGVDATYSPVMDDIKVLVGVSTTLPWGGD